MSWNVGYTSLLDFMEDKRSEYSTQNLGSECVEQLEASRKAVLNILESKSVGFNKDYLINLSGHANSNHEPASGWANDCVSISITQKS